MPTSRLALAPVVVGAASWVACPLVPRSPLTLGSVEHGFLFFPLVAVPLALRLASSLSSAAGGYRYRFARALQPFAALLVLASFFVAKGTVAGVLTLAWLLMALVFMASGVRWASGEGWSSLVAAHVFLPVAAVWLLLSRLGIEPRRLSALTVLLATLHFHASGFVLQILIAAAGRRIAAPRSVMTRIHRTFAVGAVAAMPLIAAGNLAAVPALKFAGVVVMVLSTVTLAVTNIAMLRSVHSVCARRLLVVSSSSLAAAMLVALVYGVGELTGADWIGVSRMVLTHGLLNALGFFLCGLGGELVEASQRQPHGRHAHPSAATTGGDFPSVSSGRK